MVVFDVDGTLYNQRKLRLEMASMLVRHCILRGDISTPRVLGTYRRLRETLADNEVHDFETRLISDVAKRWRTTPARVREVVGEWIDSRPLPLLRACRFEGLGDLFDRLRDSGRTIGILSDYPARLKLEALELEADHVVAAGDPEVGIMKPDPRGLRRLLDLARVDAGSTIMIGDRAERDGEMARRAEVRCYLRSSKPIEGWTCFKSYAEVAAGLAA